MTEQELKAAQAPFFVVSKHDRTQATIVGFSENDPLGVGGGLFDDMATAYFDGGGWCLVRDLMRHWDVGQLKCRP